MNIAMKVATCWYKPHEKTTYIRFYLSVYMTIFIMSWIYTMNLFSKYTS